MKFHEADLLLYKFEQTKWEKKSQNGNVDHQDLLKKIQATGDDTPW